MNAGRLNRWLDSLPRSHVRLGGMILPAYLAWGLAGAAAGSAATPALAALSGRSLPVAVTLGPVALAIVLVTGLARQRLTGTETHALLQSVASVTGGVALLLWVTGLPVLANLDLLVFLLCVLFAFARIGCLVNGCCYGLPSGVGIVYPAECYGGHAGARLFPVQGIEALVWTGLALLGAALVLGAPPGSALAGVLAVYGIARIALEAIRGDPRPRLAGVSEGVWWSLAAIGAALAIAWHGTGVGLGELAFVASGCACAVTMAMTRHRWLRLPSEALPTAERLRSLGAEIAAAQTGDVVRDWRLGSLVVGAGLELEGSDPALVVSVSRRDPPLSRAEAAIVLRSLATGAVGVAVEPVVEDLGEGVHAAALVRPGREDP